ncbi:MAG TPA: insulinase family protein, partial [Mucilaginibacter sp.]
EISTVGFNGLQENFAATVKLYEDLLANCQPDENALAALKARLKKARENAKLNKTVLAQALVSYAQYGPSNPFNYTLSDEELDNLKAQDLVDILHKLNSYKHIILYYGPQTAAREALALAKLHKTPATFIPYPEKHNFVKDNADHNRVLFANYDMVQAEIYWVRNEGAYSPEQTPRVDLFNNYFGGGMSTVVFQQIRESKALAYSTYAYYISPVKKEDQNYFIGYIGTQADKLNESIKSMNELLTNLPRSDKSLMDAKENIRKSIETGRITQDGILFNYLEAQRLGLNYDIRKTTLNSLDKMNFETVKEFHDQQLKGKPFTYCIVASDKRVNDDDLKKYGELIKPDLKQLFGY